MIKTFPINFVQAALEQTLLMAHINNPDFFGGKNQISLSSFYQQLKNQDEVDRFVEQFQDLVQQQNRLNLIGNGILLSPENPTITNLYSCLIIPMTYNCAIRCQLSNRDQMLETINNLIEELKGAKCDIAQLKCRDSNGKVFYQPFMVGTIGHNEGAPALKDGDYIGSLVNASGVTSILTNLTNLGISVNTTKDHWYYCENANKLKVIYYNKTENTWSFIEDDGTYGDIIFPPEHNSFEKFKLSMSFESLRCDTPYTLDSEEYCEISFGGSATLVNDSIVLGNDLVKVAISKYGIKTSTTPITYSTPATYYVEPLEMPSGNNANTKINQLVSNKFLNNSHTDAISLTLQYTFVIDTNNVLLRQWFEYGRYGLQNISESSDIQTMTPNLIYTTKEYWSAWGTVGRFTFKTKLVENIDIENTEGDTLTLGVTLQIQGDND